LLPSSGVMKPNPLESLNHFTVPYIVLSLAYRSYAGLRTLKNRVTLDAAFDGDDDRWYERVGGAHKFLPRSHQWRRSTCASGVGPSCLLCWVQARIQPRLFALPPVSPDVLALQVCIANPREDNRGPRRCYGRFRALARVRCISSSTRSRICHRRVCVRWPHGHPRMLEVRPELGLPGCDGVAAEEIRRILPECNIIFLSQHSQQSACGGWNGNKQLRNDSEPTASACPWRAGTARPTFLRARHVSS
jgi:hypothetical protein